MGLFRTLISTSDESRTEKNEDLPQMKMITSLYTDYAMHRFQNVTLQISFAGLQKKTTIAFESDEIKIEFPASHARTEKQTGRRIQAVMKAIVSKNVVRLHFSAPPV